MYNSEKYIAQTIESVQRQTFEDWEYIIADNMSTDRSREIALRYSDDTRIKVVVAENKGKSFARNAAFAQCGGLYVANIDSDDLWQADKLTKQVRLLEVDSNLALVYTGIELINERGNSIGRRKPSDISSNPLKYILTEKNPITHSSVLIRRAVLGSDGYQLDGIEEADELIVYLKTFLMSNNARLIDEPLTIYRIHRESGLQRVDLEHYVREYRKGLDVFFSFANLPKNVQGYRRRSLGTMYYLTASVGIYQGRQFRLSLYYLLKSLWLRPLKAHLVIYRILRLSVKILTKIGD